MQTIFDTPRIRYISHRGFRPLAPDNTAAAFTYAGLLRQWAIETDVRKTKDGVLVCCHDETVDALFDGSGAVQDMNWEELRKLRCKSGSRIPCLEEEQLRMPLFSEYLTICKRYGSVPFVELKTADTGQVVREVRDMGFSDAQVVMSSTQLPFLEEIRKHTQQMFVHWIFAEEEGLNRLCALGNAGLSWNIPNVADCSPEKIHMTHRLGLKVCLRAGDDVETVRRMLALELDYIPTNNMHMPI